VQVIAGGSLATMTAGMLWPFAFGVLAAVILDELQLAFSAFGVAYATYYLSASVGSPLVGRLVDRLEYGHTSSW
jgi:MFS family permease